MLYLADKSAYERRRHSEGVRTAFVELASTGTLATCEIVALEVLYSARNLADYEQLRADLDSLEWLGTTDTALRRALTVQHDLAKRGQHRLPLPDLIIAATAEQYGAAVLHYDKGYDLIAAVTGQPVVRVAPREG
ncbi:MAG: PIN domain nuclease [Egibacteraceae bacterium]